MPFRRSIAFTALFCIFSNPLLARPDYFTPQHRLSGLGVDRAEISEAVLAERTDRMIQAQTFAIMRDPHATAGAERITSPRLAKIFRDASESSGLPASLISAIAYLESWGESDATSPAGPRGIMQFSEATARAAGLRVERTTKFRVTTQRKQVKGKNGKLVYRTVRQKTPYTVTVRDDRLNPERAVPAAANYLARMEKKFGGRDWAVFGYHCGEGCIAEVLPLAQAAIGRKQAPTVAGMFFAANPALHRDLYQTLERHMARDFSPTYWFRISRAEQLLILYQSDKAAFHELAEEYRNPMNPERRANDRLTLWLKSESLYFRSLNDLRQAGGKALARVFDDPKYFGFSVSKMSGDPATLELYLQASPAALGTLLYIAFETRRLFEALKPKGEHFVPLQVTELVTTTDRPAEAGVLAVDPQFPAHSTGQVFDLDRSDLPRGERECLNFILDDMGWDGYLGFVQVAGDSVHIGCAPAARDFFASVFEDALGEK